MKNARGLLLSCILPATMAIGLHAGEIKHRFLAIDEGNCALIHVDENDPSRDYSVPIGKASPRDMQLIGKGLLLIGHENGYIEVDIATGAIVKDFSGMSKVTSARRQPNGHTLLVGIGDAGADQIFVKELDKNDATLRTLLLPYGYVRLMRQTAKGNYLLVCDTKVVEAAPKGEIVWEGTVEYLNHAWKALRMPNGNTLVSAGYGAFVAELDPAGALVRKYGAREDLTEEYNPGFYATIQALPAGNVVVANWQGHGPGHGDSGIQLIEFDEDGKVAWQWSDASMISSLQGILILDGLDLRLLHDERKGVMAPQKK